MLRGPGRVLLRRDAAVPVETGEPHAPAAVGRKFCRAHRNRDVGGALDFGDDDAQGAEIQRRPDRLRVHRRDADEWCNSRGVGGLNHGAHGLRTDVVLQQIDANEIETRVSQQLDRGRRRDPRVDSE